MPFCALLLLLIAGALETRPSAQEPVPSAADKATNEVAVSRPCPSRSAHSSSNSKDKSKSKSAPSSQEPVSTCLEAKGTPVDLQEFFQSYVREQRWRIRAEKIAEDAWIFSRFLDKDELAQLVKEGPLAGRVKWAEGKALVQIETHALEGGFTRVEVLARFQGGGQSLDRFAPPRDSWNLDSNGTLERMLIVALEAHLKSLHSFPAVNTDNESVPQSAAAE